MKGPVHPINANVIEFSNHIAHRTPLKDPADQTARFAGQSRRLDAFMLIVNNFFPNPRHRAAIQDIAIDAFLGGATK